MEKLLIKLCGWIEVIGFKIKAVGLYAIIMCYIFQYN